jgi:hypothetical protein
MKYRYTLDYEETARADGKRIKFVPGQVYDLQQVPNRVAAHLVPVQEEAPAIETPAKKAAKKTIKKKKQS